MPHYILLLAAFCVFIPTGAFALQPDQILVVANADVTESVQIARYYCTKRNVPEGRILTLKLGPGLGDTISRGDYNNGILHPIQKELQRSDLAGTIRCLLLVYGIPTKVGGRGPAEGQEKTLERIERLKEQGTDKFRAAIAQLKFIGREKLPDEKPPETPSIRTMLEQIDKVVQESRVRIEGLSDPYLKKSHMRLWLNLRNRIYGGTKHLQGDKTGTSQGLATAAAERTVHAAENANWTCAEKLKNRYYEAIELLGGLKAVIGRLAMDVDCLQGKETSASVDSELTMALHEPYELYRWQINDLRGDTEQAGTLMTCRLDGPGADIARGLIDKAIASEKSRPTGVAYIDSRGIADDGKPYSFGYYDQSLRDLARLLKTRTDIPVVEETTPEVFSAGRCPGTLLYCGWYSLKTYVDAFDFVQGAVGYHIASWEAVDLRDPASSQWCPAMLVDGITATLGAVAEPYLPAFPPPAAFFAELLRGHCLAEAFFHTNPFNSWQMILIGDPLYRPFGP